MDKIINSQEKDYKKQAKELKYETRAFIAGQYCDSASGDTFSCHSPIDNRTLGKVASCDKEDVNRAVSAARHSFELGVWRKVAPMERKKILLRFAELIEKNSEALAILETLDVGKPIIDSLNFDIPSTVKTIRWYAEGVDKLYGEVAPAPTDIIATVSREPVGVVGCVIPWNFPSYMAAVKFAPALAAGNSVILKPAEQSPLTAIQMGKLANEAGIPEGVFNVLPGFGKSVGEPLGRHMDVDAIGFTGSTLVGKYFLRYSAESNMKKVSLEAGGKSPHIVLADTPDLDLVATEVADNIFFNQGEICDAGSRLIVERSIFDELVYKVCKIAKKIKVGNPLLLNTEMGAIVDKTQMHSILSYIDKGEKEGAKLCVGGKQVNGETGGFYIEPTVFDNVHNRMSIAQEEIFGPVLATIPCSGTEDAIRIANDTRYGLAAAIWTSDINKALWASKELRAGSVFVNNYSDSDLTVPFGGFKQSGLGRDKSLSAFHNYTDAKTTWIKIRNQ